jgi:hypothetical protein
MNNEDPAFQPHTYDSRKNTILISGTVAELSICISVLTGVGLDGMTGNRDIQKARQPLVAARLYIFSSSYFNFLFHFPFFSPYEHKEVYNSKRVFPFIALPEHTCVL